SAHAFAGEAHHAAHHTHAAHAHHAAEASHAHHHAATHAHHAAAHTHHAAHTAHPYDVRHHVAHGQYHRHRWHEMAAVLAVRRGRGEQQRNNDGQAKDIARLREACQREGHKTLAREWD